MASTRMLTQLLRDDNIAYAVRPVSTFSQIIENKDTYITSDIKVIFMINCGAVYNINKALNLSQSERRCFILDNHRPFHLANVHSRENVVVFDDKTPDAIELDTARSSMFNEESADTTYSQPDNLLRSQHGGTIDFDFPASDDDSDYSDRSSDSSEGDSDDHDEMQFEDELSEDEDLENNDEEAASDDEDQIGEAESDDVEDEAVDVGDGDDDAVVVSTEDTDGINQNNVDNIQESDNTMNTDAVDDDAVIADLSDNGSNSAPTNADYISSDNSNETSGEGSNTSSSGKRATDGEAEINDGNEDEDDTQPRGVKRKGLQQKYDPKKQKKIEYKNYYRKFYDHAPPTAVMMYNLISSRGGSATPLEHIWQAVLGVMDQYHKYRLSEENFQGCREWLREILGDHVSASNSSSQNSRYTVGEGDQEVVIPGAETGHIVHSRDYKLFLYRHQSLFDAMFHSPIVASSLHIWSQSQGEGKLREVLATLGLPLQQCKQLFNFMNPSMRRHFHAEVTKDRSSVLEPHLDENGTEIRNKSKDEFDNEKLIANFCKELIGYSFFRYNSFRNPVSSSDVVLAASALLEMCKSEDFAPLTHADSRGAQNDENVNNQNAAAINQSNTNNGMKKESGGNLSMMVAFNDAYDCLGMRSDDLLKKGINTAIAIQKAIVRRATMLLEEGSDALHSMHRFYYTNINNISESGRGTSGGTLASIATNPNSRSHSSKGNNSNIDFDSNSQDIDSIFSRPLVLARLGHFVMDVKRSLKKKDGGWVGSKLFPFFLLSKRRDRMLIVGVSPLHGKFGEKEGPDGVNNMSEQQINNLKVLASFKHFYKAAAVDLKIEYKCDGFDSNIIEIAVEDAYDFIGNLDRLYREAVNPKQLGKL